MFVSESRDLKLKKIKAVTSVIRGCEKCFQRKLNSNAKVIKFAINFLLLADIQLHVYRDLSTLHTVDRSLQVILGYIFVISNKVCLEWFWGIKLIGFKEGAFNCQRKGNLSIRVLKVDEVVASFFCVLKHCFKLKS